jgi:hypothetical protein
MDEPEEMLHQLGAFDPMDAKKLLPQLEQAGITFEVEADHTELQRPGRAVQLYLGTYPEGSKLAVFVRESDLPRAQTVITQLFPI